MSLGLALNQRPLQLEGSQGSTMQARARQKEFALGTRPFAIHRRDGERARPPSPAVPREFNRPAHEDKILSSAAELVPVGAVARTPVLSSPDPNGQKASPFSRPRPMALDALCISIDADDRPHSRRNTVSLGEGVAKYCSRRHGAVVGSCDTVFHSG